MSSKFARLKLSAIKLCHTLRIRWVIRLLTNALFWVNPTSPVFPTKGEVATEGTPPVRHGG